MPTNITVSTLTNEIVVDSTTNDVSVNTSNNAISVTPQVVEVAVNKSTQEIFVNTRTNKADIGLGNVDNTSDLDKPISTATKLYVDTEIDYLTTADIEENGNLYFTNARADARVAAGIAAIDYPVDSVNGKTGAVNLSTSDISEGTNLYYTQARVDARFNELAGDLNFPVTSVNGQTGVVTLDSDDIAEGTTNLYYTDGRVGTYLTTNNYATQNYAITAANTAAGIAESNSNSYTNNAIAAIDYPVDSVNGKSGAVSLTTSDIAEGTNLYYTDGRVSTYLTTNNYATQSYADTAASTAESNANSYADSAIAALVNAAPETLDTLNELAAALGDDPNYATTISTALGQKFNTVDFGSEFDGQFEGKSTTDLAEGTNLYFTTARAREAYTGTGNITVNATTGVISFDGPTGPDTTDELTEGTTNLYYTEGRVDANFATKTTDNLAEGTTNRYYSSALFDADLATKNTNDLAEGTNLYFTTTRAREAYTGTGNITVNATTGVISFEGPTGPDTTDELTEGTTNLYYTDARVRAVVDNNVDLDVDGSNNVYVKSLRNGTRIKGEVQATTDDSYVFPSTPLNGVSDNNGYSAASSISGNAGNGANALYTHFDGDTFSAANSAAALNLQNARGNSVAGVILPWTGTLSVAPSATQSQDVLGTLNFNGYCTTDFGNRVGTQYQGGGVNTLHGIQFQSYAAENFSNSTLTIPAANITAVSSFRVALTTPTVTGTKGQISFGTTTPAVGQAIRVTGTLTGNATGIVSGQNYWIIATNGTTTATLSATPGGLPIDTTGTTLTGLTLTRCGVTLTISGQSKYPYGRNSILNVSGLNNITNGAYPVGGIPTLTSVVLGIPHAVAPTLSGSQSLSIDTPYMASGFRIRAFPLATPANTSNRITIFDHSVATATYKSDQYTFQGGTNTFNYMSLNAAGGTFSVGSMVIKDLAGTSTYATINSSGLTLGPQGSGNISYNRTYGCFHKMANVTAAAANTVYNFDWYTSATAHVGNQGVTVTSGNPTRIAIDTAGQYEAVIEMLVKNTDNAERTAWIWIAKNGTDLAETRIKVGIRPASAGANTYQVITKLWMLDNIAANDYIEVRFAVDNISGISLEYEAAQTSPFVMPAQPSATITIVPVGA